MAIGKILPLHINKGKTLIQSLTDRIDYGKNPDKTDDFKYISSYECDPRTVNQEWVLAKQEYERRTGRHQKDEHNVIGYQLVQSFKPGEITPEEANRIGYELAMRWTKGKYAFVVCTHVDKHHIHNHIYYNSTALDYMSKWDNPLNSYKYLQNLNDVVCLENGLSIITPKSYNDRTKRTEWPKKETARDRIRAAIDEAMAKNPKSFDELLCLLREQGYQYKPGKRPGLIGNEMKKVARFDSLGEGYTVEDLTAVIAKEKEFTPKVKQAPEKSTQSHVTPRMQFLIDIQAKIQEGKGGGYVRWAKTFNLKQSAQALIFISEHNISSLEELTKKASEMSKKEDDLRTSIKKDEARLQEISELKTHIINYAKSKETFAQYKASGYSRDFFETHRDVLTLRHAASNAFREYEKKYPSSNGGKIKLPSIKELDTEHSQVLERKKKNYAEFQTVRSESRDYAVASKIVEAMFDDEHHPEQAERPSVLGKLHEKQQEVAVQPRAAAEKSKTKKDPTL